MPHVIANIVSDLRPVRRPARVLYAGASLFLLSAVVHLGALILDGWQWSGAVSFRKPLVFSLSVGLLLGTLGWVLDRLPDRPRLAGALAWSFLISSVVEVGLIAMQTWRGRASHFNVLAGGDAAVFAAMGAAVGVMSLCLIGALVWSAIEMPSDGPARLAVIGGLALVATGLGFGQWIIELGNEYVAANQVVPDTVTYGEQGVAKFPHAVAFHGIQVFIVSAVMLGRSRLPTLDRRRLMRLIFWSYTGILVFASAQTLTGQAPLEVSIWSIGLAASLAGVGLGLTRIALAQDTGAGAEQEATLAVP
ncbi:MAG TPA: hypothetical protein VK969_07205 [Acidimicrobiia bacterium]|nr:hypothetical protein [Acidimicrobiia bacterium]